MKKIELIFSAILVPVDFLMLLLAGITAYKLRFASPFVEIRPVVYELAFSKYIRILLIAVILWLVIFAFSGLYNIHGTKKKLNELIKIFGACSIGVLAIIIAFFFKRELFSSRFIILSAWIISILYVSIARLFLRYIQQLLFQRGIGLHRVVLVGKSNTTEIIANEFKNKTKLGFGIIDIFPEFSNGYRQKLQKLIEHKKVDEVFLLDSNLTKQEILELYDFCKEHHLVFKYASDFFGTLTSNFEISTIADVPIIEIKRTRLDGWGRIIKRILDIVGATVALIVFLPLLLLVAVAIKIDSPGPIIYKNKRMSKEGEFNIYKFRYMYTQYCTGKEYGGEFAEQYEKKLIKEQSIRKGPLYKIRNDPRRTRVGKIIERFSIDELPQLFNVILGNMSLVGPRPHQPREVAKYQKHHKIVFSVKPGITGMAQISGRSDLDFEDEVRLDSFYIENWSLLLDIIIILKTPIAVFKKRLNN